MNETKQYVTREELNNALRNRVTEEELNIAIHGFDTVNNILSSISTRAEAQMVPSNQPVKADVDYIGNGSFVFKFQIPSGKNGKDGVDGKDGINGTNGSNGIDGLTPTIDYDSIYNEIKNRVDQLKNDLDNKDYSELLEQITTATIALNNAKAALENATEDVVTSGFRIVIDGEEYDLLAFARYINKLTRTVNTYNKIVDTQQAKVEEILDSVSIRTDDGSSSVININSRLDALNAQIEDSVKWTSFNANGEVDKATFVNNIMNAMDPSFESRVGEVEIDGDTLNNHVSSIKQTKDSINLLVEDGKVNAASIIAAINEGESEVKISADKVDIDGEFTVTSDGIKTAITKDGLNINNKFIVDPSGNVTGNDCTFNNGTFSGSLNITKQVNEYVGLVPYNDGVITDFESQPGTIIKGRGKKVYITSSSNDICKGMEVKMLTRPTGSRLEYVGLRSETPNDFVILSYTNEQPFDYAYAFSYIEAPVVTLLLCSVDYFAFTERPVWHIINIFGRARMITEEGEIYTYNNGYLEHVSTNPEWKEVY